VILSKNVVIDECLFWGGLEETDITSVINMIDPIKADDF
jgi:hypothetical protein